MSTASTINFIRAYFQDARPVQAFSRFFQSPRENFYNQAEIEIDIVRSGEDVAVAVQDLTAGYRANSVDIYTNKKFTAPVFKEKFGLDSHDLMNRMPGKNPFENHSYRAAIVEKMLRGMRKVEEKIRRANELQRSQVLQTGTATLIDSSGAEIYAIDYQPKATHFPTSGTAWDSGGDVKGDLISLCNVIRNDGLVDPNLTVWGEDAYEAALANADFKASFETRRIDAGSVMPMAEGGTGGLNFRGTLDLGNYKIEIWTYGARYKHPQTGVSTQFMDPGKVIVMASGARFDATFGGVPHIGRELGISGQNILPELPSRFGNSEGGMDMFTNVWLTDDGEQLFGGVASRPLYIPTAIDQYGCLDTGV